jgi:hypothetical protein
MIIEASKLITVRDNLRVLTEVIARYIKLGKQLLQSLQSACNFLMYSNI